MTSQGSESRPSVLREFYNDYTPPSWVFKTAGRLLLSVPDKYVRGLDSVVLTNYSGQPRRHRIGTIASRKRKVAKSRILGLYHRACRGKSAWIELYVDNISTRAEQGRWIPSRREFSLGQVLFHEIGHHIHATAAPEYAEKEDVADRWGRDLFANYYWHRYWYLKPVRRPLIRLLKAWVRFLLASRNR